MGNSNSMFPKFQNIWHQHKRKKKSIAVFCSDERNANYFECLSAQNGGLEHPGTCMFCSYGSKQVRGEIVSEQNLNYDDNKVKDYQHVYTEMKLSVGRTVLSNQKEYYHDTLQKFSYKCGLKPQMPRKYDLTVGSCHDSDSLNNVTKTHENINSGKEGSSVKYEYRSDICCLEISENDSGIESLQDILDLQDSLDMDMKRFAEYWNTKGSMGHFSQESLNSVTSDDADSNPGIVPKYGMQSRDGSTTPGTVNSIGSYTSSHRYCSSSCSTRNDEDGFISEGYRGSLSGSIKFSAEHQDSSSSDGILYETSKKDELVFNDAIPNKGKTGPEPFVESSHSEWDIEEDCVSGENSESISCVQSINVSLDNDTCLDVNVITADKFKKDGDISQDGYKKHHHVLTDHHSTHVNSTENATSCQMFNKLDEETSIYNQNEPQSVSISQHLNPCITKLGIVQMHNRIIPFNLESISKTELSLSLRESNVTFSSRSFSGKGLKEAIREMTMKQSRACEQPRRLYSSSVQSQHDGIPVSELGIAERDPYFQLGALGILSSDDNVFKQRSDLRWIFQYGSVSQGSVLRLQHWLRHYQLYPFTNIKDFWTSLSTDSPLSVEECMSVEWMRYKSFQNYPISAYGSTTRLARDGFYYTGQGTQTRCFSCGITHSDWNRTDNPHEVHQRLSPDCPFLNGRQERYPNIPMCPDENVAVGRADRDSMPLPSLPVTPLSVSGTSQSQTEGRRLESREGSGATKTVEEDNTTGQQQNLGSGETTPGVPSHPVEESAQSGADNRPKFPEKVSLPSRIATFSHGWPPYLDQTPQQMAEAGFFFTGSQDYTRCYQCGGGLRNWEPGDNPWIEHCRWYPMCPHVQKGKGQRFVNAVLKKQAELLANQRADSRMKAQYGIQKNFFLFLEANVAKMRCSCHNDCHCGIYFWSGSIDPLETLAAITLLEMGYPRDTVRNSILILRRQKELGAEINAQEVLDFIWKEEDIERQRQEEEASRPRHPGDPQPPALPTLMERLNLGGSPAVTQTGVMQSASNVTTTSSLTMAAMTVTSDTMTSNSTLGAASLTSMSTLASGSTQNSHASGQEQKPDENQEYKTTVGGAGNKRGGSMTRDGVPEANVKADSHAQNREVSKQEQQRPIGAIGGHPEEPGANAHAIAEAIEDEEFHSLDSEEMENKDPVELEEENKRLKEQTTCKICMENPVRVIFIPCGHLVCCETCAPAFRKCPICRKRIQQAIKTFL